MIRCPSCRGALVQDASGARCGACGLAFAKAGRWLDLRSSAHAGTREVAAWDRVGENRYQGLSEVEHRHCLRSIQEMNLVLLPSLQDLDVLEIGSGKGHLTAALLAKGAAVHAVDFSPAFLDRAAVAAPGASLFLADARALPFGDASFDLVVASEVIEHIPETALFLSEIRRVLKPGGRAELSTPNGNILLHPKSLLAGLLKPKSFLRCWRGRDSWSPTVYDRILRPGPFRREVEGAGFQVESWTGGVWYFEGGILHPLFYALEPLAPALMARLFGAYLDASERLVRILPGLGIRQAVLARKAAA